MPLTPDKFSADIKYINEVLKETAKESDRAAAILIAAEMDRLLQNIVEKLFFPKAKTSDPDLFESGGPIDNFSSRIEIAYRLGLMPKHYHDDLHIIRKIRNKFAHAPKGLTFNDPPITDWVKQLSTPQGIVKELSVKSGGKVPPQGTPRVLIFYAASALLPSLQMSVYTTPRPREHFKGEQKVTE